MLRSCFLSNFFVSRSAVSEEKSKMSQPIMGHGGHLFFTERSEKHRLGKRRWDLASCQVSLNSVQRFQRRSRKCLSQSEASRYFIFPMGPKNTNLVEDIEIFSPVKFCWIPFSSFRGKVENVSANQRPGGHLVFPIGPKNTNLVEDVVSEEKLKMWKFTPDGRRTDGRRTMRYDISSLEPSAQVS